uniref:Uncharacterized protein n=1 Tax=Brassica oleracea TaxID=3712 RepID=A0A3P6DBI0_BRAOL|nr:unnamed protein product [Brassica oleracea]
MMMTTTTRNPTIVLLLSPPLLNQATSFSCNPSVLKLDLGCMMLTTFDCICQIPCLFFFQFLS